MSLLVNESQLFDVIVIYARKNGELEFFEEGKAPAGAVKETFKFKRPTWTEARDMMSASVLVDAVSGRSIIDPYKFMDMKVKTLIKDWSLNHDGKKLELSEDNIDKLEPALVQHLFDRLEQRSAPAEAATIVPVAS